MHTNKVENASHKDALLYEIKERLPSGTVPSKGKVDPTNRYDIWYVLYYFNVMN